MVVATGVGVGVGVGVGCAVGTTVVSGAAVAGAPVVNVRSAPVTGPPENSFTATSRKWNVVLGSRPLTTALTACSVKAAPALATGVVLP